MSSDNAGERFRIDIQFRDDNGQWYRCFTDREIVGDDKQYIVFQRTYGFRNPPVTIAKSPSQTLYDALLFTISHLRDIRPELIDQLRAWPGWEDATESDTPSDKA